MKHDDGFTEQAGVRAGAGGDCTYFTGNTCSCAQRRELCFLLFDGAKYNGCIAQQRNLFGHGRSDSIGEGTPDPRINGGSFVSQLFGLPGLDWRGLNALHIQHWGELLLIKSGG